MANRQPLSKKLRFEIFKRDKFTCQYCGRKAPDIVLHVDHINPVAKGGGNDILNLITSCIDCNSGKRDRQLDDKSVLEKQRKQLELLQERREQIELMIEWKKSLSDLDNDVCGMIIEYINGKIKPLCLNESGKQAVQSWNSKYSAEKILEAVDEAAKVYIKYNGDEIDRESVETFLQKIVGVIIVKDMPLIKQKLAYIKGIARNRFSFWDDRMGSMILDKYVSALETKGWTLEEIIEDLEKEVSKATRQSKNWSEWRNTIEGWTEDIHSC